MAGLSWQGFASPTKPQSVHGQKKKKKIKEKRWKFWCWTTNQSTDQSITEPPAGLLQDADTLQTSPIFGAASKHTPVRFLFSLFFGEAGGNSEEECAHAPTSDTGGCDAENRSKITSRDESNPSVFSHVYPL